MLTVKQIHQKNIKDGMTAADSVSVIAVLMKRAESTVWGWVSNRPPNDEVIEILNSRTKNS